MGSKQAKNEQMQYGKICYDYNGIESVFYKNRVVLSQEDDGRVKMIDACDEVTYFKDIDDFFNNYLEQHKFDTKFLGLVYNDKSNKYIIAKKMSGRIQDDFLQKRVDVNKILLYLKQEGKLTDNTDVLFSVDIGNQELNDVCVRHRVLGNNVEIFENGAVIIYSNDDIFIYTDCNSTLELSNKMSVVKFNTLTFDGAKIQCSHKFCGQSHSNTALRKLALYTLEFRDCQIDLNRLDALVYNSEIKVISFQDCRIYNSVNIEDKVKYKASLIKSTTLKELVEFINTEVDDFLVGKNSDALIDNCSNSKYSTELNIDLSGLKFNNITKLSKIIDSSHLYLDELIGLDKLVTSNIEELVDTINIRNVTKPIDLSTSDFSNVNKVHIILNLNEQYEHVSVREKLKYPDIKQIHNIKDGDFTGLLKDTVVTQELLSFINLDGVKSLERLFENSIIEDVDFSKIKISTINHTNQCCIEKAYANSMFRGAKLKNVKFGDCAWIEDAKSIEGMFDDAVLDNVDFGGLFDRIAALVSSNIGYEENNRDDGILNLSELFCNTTIKNTYIPSIYINFPESREPNKNLIEFKPGSNTFVGANRRGFRDLVKREPSLALFDTVTFENCTIDLTKTVGLDRYTTLMIGLDVEHNEEVRHREVNGETIQDDVVTYSLQYIERAYGKYLFNKVTMQNVKIIIPDGYNDKGIPLDSIDKEIVSYKNRIEESLRMMGAVQNSLGAWNLVR